MAFKGWFEGGKEVNTASEKLSYVVFVVKISYIPLARKLRP